MADPPSSGSPPHNMEFMDLSSLKNDRFPQYPSPPAPPISLNLVSYMSMPLYMGMPSKYIYKKGRGSLRERGKCRKGHFPKDGGLAPAGGSLAVAHDLLRVIQGQELAICGQMYLTCQ